MRVYTIEEIAEILKMGVSSVRKIINDGRIKKLDTDGLIRVSQAALDAYLRGE